VRGDVVSGSRDRRTSAAPASTVGEVEAVSELVAVAASAVPVVVVAKPVQARTRAATAEIVRR